MTTLAQSVREAPPRSGRSTLYLQVLVAIVAGVLLGHLAPDVSAKLKPLGDAFVRLLGMIAAPLIFTTVVLGLAGLGDLKKLGRLGLKALIYFEVVTTLALVIGLVVGTIVQPGAGMNIDPATFSPEKTETYATAAKAAPIVEFLLGLIPRSFVAAFVDGQVLQVLLLAVLFGLAMARLGEHARPLLNLLNVIARILFAIVGIIVRFAPIAAFGAMAFTIGKYGLGTLVSLGELMLCVYVTCALFIFGVLAAIARLAGFRLWSLLRLIREEILIVFGTSSSEAGLPGLMEKMEKAGCSRATVGLMVPAGYSFNLDGTCIYVTIAALFIAQATNTPLSGGDLVTLLLVLMLTSKGAAAITGGGFITLTATLAAMGKIPLGGLALVVGVDRFMSEARAITNVIGVAVATMAVSRWEGEIAGTTERVQTLPASHEPTPRSDASPPEASNAVQS